jgi:hypothetical protein
MLPAAAGCSIAQCGPVCGCEVSGACGRPQDIEELAIVPNENGAGSVLLTSRVSVEMAQKAAVMDAPFIVAVSAPTAPAVRMADAAGRRSRYVVQPRDSSLVFQATDLSHILARELQPDAGTHPVAFREKNGSEGLQGPAERPRFIVGNPGGSA